MKKHLKPEGSIHLILPPQEAKVFIANASEQGLHLIRFCAVKSRAVTETKRCLFSLGRNESLYQNEELILYGEDGARHPQHAKLTQDFYL